MPRRERGLELPGLVDAEVRKPRPDPAGVDDPIAEVAVREADVRLEGRLDERRLGARPRDAAEHADVATFDEAEAARPAGDLRQLPRQRSRRSWPSNLLVSAKSSVSHGRLTP